MCNEAGGAICVRAGTYEITQDNGYVHIGCDNITLRGEGPSTQFNVAETSRTPAIVVGDDRDIINDGEINDLVVVHNVTIEQISVNGGWDGSSGQSADDELHAEFKFLRNNGILIRFAEHVLVDKVISMRNRSGGVTTEGMFDVPCQFISVANSELSENFFDGLSFNRTVLSRVYGNVARNNRLTGLTSEYLADSVIEDNSFVDNNDHGAYMSDSYRNSVSTNQIHGNTNSGIFLTENEAFPGTVSKFNVFSGNVFSCNSRPYELPGAITCTDEPNTSHGDIFQCNLDNNSTGTCLAYWDSREFSCPDRNAICGEE